jgi:tripartite-type tricarboxylate transporter receptor subunit TctC
MRDLLLLAIHLSRVDILRDLEPPSQISAQGYIAVGFPTIYSALPYIRANRLRGLAVTTSARSPAISELPTLAEAGVSGVEVVSGRLVFDWSEQRP